MTQSVPLIRSVPMEPLRLRFGGRLVALTVAAGCLGVLVLAAILQPSPTGVGTHTATGMASCSWIDKMGIPCPSCGMTTSFAWFARGNLLASFYVQPMGMVLALLCALCFWGALYVAITGRPSYRMLRFVPGKYLLWPPVFFAALAWGWKIYIHTHGMDGWK